MRLGIFGGSFDPIHNGHLKLAAAGLECCGLDQVWFVPAWLPPHKQDRRQTPGPLRAQMVELAIADHERFELCRMELDRGGISYTIDTLTEIRRQRPHDELFLLLGADSLQDLPTWHRPVEICRLARPVVVDRPGSRETDFVILASILSAEDLANVNPVRAEMPACDISSSEIRRRVAAAESIEGLTPRAVAEFITQQGLYREN
jgi:nicotinate-nucleotide adenylyltransferase